jgi:hypothetical protein
MEFLYGSWDNGAPKHTYVEGLNHRYDAWEVNGIWHQELKVVGKGKAIVTLRDEEVMLWEYLDLAKRSRAYGGMGNAFKFLNIVFYLLLLFLALIYTMVETMLSSFPWYLTYPLLIFAPVLAVTVTVFIEVARSSLLRIKRKYVLLSFLKKLQKETGKNNSYYKALLLKVATVKDKDRAETARMLLDKGLV